MRRNWGKFAQAAGSAVAAFIFAQPAAAGDAATLNVLGFSADGGVFAFEEYGVQDGSGFPYANRFYIDTAADRFLAGTPIRVTLEQDGATVAQARAAAGDQTKGIVADAVLAAKPGFAAGRNAITELSADPSRIVVNPRPVFPPLDEPLELRLEEIPAAAPADCAGLGDIKGFRLIRIASHDARQIIHEDSKVPSSRGCPLGYMIGGVQTFHPEGAPPVYAVLIAIRQVGFEGPSHRWMAVTSRFDR